MNITALLIFLATGAVASWLAGLLMRGGGFGLLGNILVGFVGSIVGGFLFGLFGITAGGLSGSLVTAVAGAARAAVDRGTDQEGVKEFPDGLVTHPRSSLRRLGLAHLTAEEG